MVFSSESNQKITALTSKIEELSANPVFFTATMDGPYGGSWLFKEKTTIRFPVIKQQLNAEFDQTGAFICRKNGIYHFDTTLLKMNDGQTYGATSIRIFHNDQQLCAGTDNDGHNYFHNLGCAATVNLKAGDKVYVELNSGSIHVAIYSSWTGFMITPMN